MAFTSRAVSGHSVTIHYSDESVTIHHGDCLDVLRTLPDASVDAVVTDPPAGIAFMSKSWDGDKGGRERWSAWLADVMREALRVTKPGGHALVWALPRTSHWTACGIEDAGWEIRDRVSHLTAQGFPKSLDVSKAIDNAAGAERPVTGPRTRPATDTARQWQGWGTALKPAAEDWWLARKPLAAGTVAGNVLAYGTGALNIVACRVGTSGGGGNGLGSHYDRLGNTQPLVRHGEGQSGATGRWPANVVLSHGEACGDRCVPGCAVAELDAQSGQSVSSDHPRHDTAEAHNRTSSMGRSSGDWTTAGHADTGGASRFFPTFRYEAKADTAQRPRHGEVVHPTVKSLGLMRWLVRLVTPPGGTVLDMFLGSGTTAEACQVEGFRCIGVEREADYLPLIVQRVTKRADPVRHLADKGDDLGLLGLLDGEAS